MYQSTSQNHSSQLYKVISAQHPNIKRLSKYLLTIKKTHTHILFYFNDDVLVTNHHGKALLIMTKDPDNRKSFEYYILDGAISIPPGVFFNTISLTPESMIYLQSQENDDPQTINLLKNVSSKFYEPVFNIQELYSITQHCLYLNESYVVNTDDYYEWIITIKGDITHDIQGKRLETPQKSALLYPPMHQGQILHGAGDPAQFLSICFQADNLDIPKTSESFNLSNFDWQLVQDIQNLSLSMFENTHTFDSDKMFTMLSTLLLSYLRDERKQTPIPVSSMRSNYESNLFHEMVGFLKEHIEERNEVNDLVEHFQLSRSTIQNLFQKYANTTPKTYINHIRLNRSKELMKHTSLSISQIAGKLGYGSLPYFSRAFSQEFGMTPSAYAKSIIK